MRFDEYISNLSFSIWQPDEERVGDRRLPVRRSPAPDARVIELPRAPVDVLNVTLPQGLESMYDMAGPDRMARMSTFAVGTIINRAVAAMPPDHSYVNVGTWMGFSLWAGMAGNPDRRCVGIDDFSLFGGPREIFYEWFARRRSRNHDFHEMDYRDYFAQTHEGPIGVYFYDGSHTYEHQLLGLQTAERFFGDECVVVVDDTNWADPYHATFDFIGQSEREYTVLLDRQTAGNGHPTFWNGLLILRTSSRSAGAAPQGRYEKFKGAPKNYDLVRVEPSAPHVSLVLRNRRSSAARLDEAIEEAVSQRWPSVEVVVADERPSAAAREVVARHGDRVTYVPRDSGDRRGTALAGAIDATRGDYVGFADAETRLAPSAVRVGLAFPDEMEFNRKPSEGSYRSLERILAVFDQATAALPDRSSFALANGRLPAPRIDAGRAMTPFLQGGAASEGRPRDDDTALERLGELRSSGVDFLVLGWRSFDWLDQFPRFRDELEAHATRLHEGDDAVVFDLRYG